MDLAVVIFLIFFGFLSFFLMGDKKSTQKDRNNYTICFVTASIGIIVVIVTKAFGGA